MAQYDDGLVCIHLSDRINTKITKLTEKVLYVVTQWHNYRKEHFYQIIGVLDNREEARKLMLETCKTIREATWMNNYPVEMEEDKATIVLHPYYEDDDYETELMIFQVDKVGPIQIKKSETEKIYVLMSYYYSCYGENYVTAKNVYLEKPMDYVESEDEHEKYVDHNILHELELNKNYGGVNF